MKKYLTGQAGNAVLVVTAILGIIALAGAVTIYVKSIRQADKIYKEMINETDTDDEDKYGTGVELDEELGQNVDKNTLPKRKAKTIIYVTPN